LTKTLNVMILNPPSPPHFDVCRDWAGGFGTATPVRRRADYGQSSKPILYPFLAYASAVISNENYSYSILDSQRLKLNKLQILRDAKKRNPDVIFSLIGLPSLKKDLELLDMIKESLPYTTIVGVGTSCRFLQNDILLNSKIDAVLRSSYPYVSNLTHFLKALEPKQNLKKVPGVSYVKNGKVINTIEHPDTSLNKLLPPNYDALELNGYESFKDLDGNRYNYVPIIGSKGCPYSCAYCPYILGWGKKWTHRSPKDIVDEIEQLYARGIEGFLFRDQSFLMNKKHTIKVCEEIIHRKLDISWFCEARVDHVSKMLLELMKKAGCKQIHFGLETGDPELIKLGKPQTDLDTTRKAFRLTKETGLWATGHVILGWPDETLETLAKTSKFIAEIDPDLVNWNFLTPYPGTKLYEMAKENNLILTYDWSKYTSHTIIMKTKWLKASQLHKAKNKIARDYSKQQMVKLLKSARKKPRFVIDELKNIIEGYFM
jgi:anaerobic magnesium-protoporphyrin IX monomethyl ester cyclase